MRISDADREQVAQVLHAAMSEGRITITELEERLTIVYAAKTVGDLKPVTADLPQTRSAIQPATSRALGLPDDINVEVTGIGFMGAFELEDRAGTPPAPPTAPTVKITGLAFWGAVTVIRKPRKNDVPEIER